MKVCILNRIEWPSSGLVCSVYNFQDCKIQTPFSSRAFRDTFPFRHHCTVVTPVLGVCAQGPPLPLTTSNNLTKDRSDGEKVSMARAAIDIEVTVATTDANGTLLFHDNTETTPTLYSQMAELDIITRNTTYRELLQDQLPRIAAEVASSNLVRFFLYDSYSDSADLELRDNSFSIICEFTVSIFDRFHILISYIRVHGYAATKAYIAYQDVHFLTLAQQLWEFGRAYCISDEDIEAKQNAKKTSSLRTECDSKSLVGGVFQACSPDILWILAGSDIIVIKTTNLTNGAIENRATAAFFTLSAVLAEATSNTTYIKAANQTLQFLKNFGYFPRSSDPTDEKVILALDSDPPCHSNTWIQWYPTTGDIIEGLSILASLQDDAATESLLSGLYSRYRLQDAINSSTLYRNNQRSDGVIQIAGMYVFPLSDPFLVRGLGTAYRKNHIDPSMREYVKDFINIQYNYLLDDASLRQSNVYVDSGVGLPRRPPARTTLSPINQTYTVMVLVQAIGSANGTDAGDPSSSPPGSPGSRSGSGHGTTKAFKTSAIVGIVVGSVAFLALLSGLIACLCLRRRRRERKVPSIYQTSPFHLPGSNEMDESSLTSPTSLASPGVRVKSRLKARYSARTHTLSPVSPTTPTTPATLASPLSPGARVQIRLDPPRPPTEPFTAGTSGESPTIVHPQNVDSGPLTDDPHARFHAMSTAEMIRILNARVQGERADTEGPPSYPQSEVG
ncbi:hypothetical protein E1B28_002019 [Marasmius oreades]|nr:uncharacterized protein E1B28_002019 [Marasmius oreades]KAG7100246.1 hypothetical protein E1B28_002019 [Marasmius oreades]